MADTIVAENAAEQKQQQNGTTALRRKTFDLTAENSLLGQRGVLSSASSALSEADNGHGPDQPQISEFQSDHEKELDELSSRLEQGYQLPRYVLYRWLKATQFDVNAAEEMYKKSQNWRKYKGIEYILHWSPQEVLRKYYPGGFGGWDKSGCPVWIIPFGRADIKGLLTAVSKQDFIDYTLRILETSLTLMEESTRRTKSPVYQHTFIFDMDQFSLKDATYGPTLEVVQALISIYEGNYPETLKAAYVINTSKVFQLVFNILQRTVNQRTLQKIKVFGQTGWKQVLLEEISGENLPEMWGGAKRSEPTKQDLEEDVKPEAAGVCLGGEVPLYYRTLKKGDEILGVSSVHKQEIGAGTSFSAKLCFRKNSSLSWKFRVEGGDIGFSIHRRRCCQKFRPSTTMNGKKSTFTLPLDESIPQVQLTKGTPSSEQVNGIEDKDITTEPNLNPEDILEVFAEVDEETEITEDMNCPLEPVLENTKVKSGRDAHTGFLLCEGGYYYTLVFDNSESIFRSRKLYFSTSTDEHPKKEEAAEKTLDYNTLAMADLMTFVKELLESEHAKRTGTFNDDRILAAPELTGQKDNSTACSH